MENYTKQDLIELRRQVFGDYETMLNMDVTVLVDLYESGKIETVKPFNLMIRDLYTGYYMLLNNLNHAIDNFKPGEATF